MDHEEVKKLSQEFKEELSKEYLLFGQKTAAFALGAIVTFLSLFGMLSWREVREVAARAAAREVEQRVGTNVLETIRLASEQAKIINASMSVQTLPNGGALRFKTHQICWGSITNRGGGNNLTILFHKPFASPPQVSVTLLPANTTRNATIWNIHDNQVRSDSLTLSYTLTRRNDIEVGLESETNAFVRVDYVAIGPIQN